MLGKNRIFFSFYFSFYVTKYMKQLGENKYLKNKRDFSAREIVFI